MTEQLVSDGADKERILTDGSLESMENFFSGKVVYVDKTGSISQLAKGRGSYLLTRPRRMGKTTMVSTLEYLFANGTVGAQKLNCYHNWKDPYRYFVFRFDWSSRSSTSAEKFERAVISGLQKYARFFGLSLPDNCLLPDIFEFLISESIVKLNDPAFLAQHPELTDDDLPPLNKKEVVLLIDEYDAPLTRNLHKNEVFDEIREVYRDLFALIKGLLFRFVFITGVSSYAQTSIFSGGNQFINLSLEDEYSTCCGYTAKEIEHYFGPELERAQQELGLTRDELMKKLSYHYDGYLFSKVEKSDNRIFSPVSVSLFLRQPRNGFESYWSDTGGSATIASELLKLCNEQVTIELLRTLYPDVFKVYANLEPNIVEFIDSWMPAVNLSISSHDQPILISVDIGALIVKIDNVKDFTSENAIAILYQAGYLSIKHIDGTTAYLGFANYEVAVTLAKQLLNQELSKNKLALLMRYKHAIDSLHDGGEALANLIDCCFNLAPDDLFDEHNRETVLTFIVHQLLKDVGVLSSREVHYVKGRADLVVYQERDAKRLEPLIEDVVIEFKVARKDDSVLDLLKSGSLQIIAKNYGVSHLNPNPKRYCIVLSNALRGVAAITSIDDSGNLKLVYKAPNLQEDLSELA